MRQTIVTNLTTWWGALLHPAEAAAIIRRPQSQPGFTRFLTILVVLLYASYGAGMGLYRGLIPALISAAKLPFLYLFTIAICFPVLYVHNVWFGPGLSPRECLRLLLLAVSANAAALASYAPISFFFSLTTSHDGYRFMVMMNVVAFALAAFISLAVIAVVFRAAAPEGRRNNLWFILSWSGFYAFVGTQMSWVLRPWIGTWSSAYVPFRPLGGSFVEALWQLLEGFIQR